jgi:hypothetical protein
MQHSEVPAQQTQVMEASVQEKVLDEHALKEYFIMSVHQALEQAGTQFPIAKLRLRSIDELHKMAIADWKAMKSLLMLCFEQAEPEALILVDESRMHALSLEELLACAVKVRDYKKRERQVLRMKENEIYVESFASNRQEDQQIETGSQQGGALQSGGSRMQKALSRIGKMVEHSTGE